MAGKNKKTENFNENFFANNIFTFDSYACDAQIEYIASPTGMETEMLKVKAKKDTPLRFAFGSKVGLVRLNADGSIAESNILGKLLAINSTYTENYIDFFNRNGFLFPISFDKYDYIESSTFKAIVNRLHATLLLMSTVTDMSRTSYEKIVRLIVYLLHAPVVQIETKDGKYTQKSTYHPYTNFLNKVDDLQLDERLEDTFNNSSFVFRDAIFQNTELPADFIISVLDGTANNKYDDYNFRKILRLFCAQRNEIPKSILLVNDFLFHYYYSVGVIRRADLESIEYVNGENCKENFSDKLKQAAMNIAKLLIKEEIEANLRRIIASYDVDKLEPTWKITSQLCALYFGLFYMRPKMEIYRRCENKKCGEYFLVSVTSRKKKYCCRACMNRDIQARHRAKEKMLASKNE